LSLSARLARYGPLRLDAGVLDGGGYVQAIRIPGALLGHRSDPLGVVALTGGRTDADAAVSVVTGAAGPTAHPS
jgi:hypothetical protein